MLRYTVSTAKPAGLESEQTIVNDVHSRLNPTIIKSRSCPDSTLALTAAIKKARMAQDKICVAGGQHAMGGQQFLQNGIFLDTKQMNRVLKFDRENGLIEVEAGIQWPELIEYLKKNQQGKRKWTIAQKQTGCDRITLGGSVSANAHGRGLKMAPLIENIEEIKIINAEGELLSLSRHQNRELFSLVAGGYGLFGIINSVTLRLAPQRTLQREVRLAESKDAVRLLEAAAANGASYGDFQFAIDHNSEDFLKAGILSTYKPIDDERIEIVGERRLLTESDWSELLYLAHSDKAAAFEKYSRHYLSTNGQLYLSDTFQLATYKDGYHNDIDKRMPHKCSGTELITELYVPRDVLGSFLAKAAETLREQKANVIYGTVRLIEKDEETFLPWAKNRWACTVVNLHVEHTPHGVAKASRTFCDLIDIAISFGGSFFFTYHRFAQKEQVLQCYPQMPDFLKLKSKYDSEELFQSDWYLHMKELIQP